MAYYKSTKSSLDYLLQLAVKNKQWKKFLSFSFSLGGGGEVYIFIEVTSAHLFLFILHAHENNFLIDVSEDVQLFSETSGI
jgi:hypothetical protein